MLYRSVVFLLLAMSLHGYGQVKKKIREYEKGFQLSLFPGISTNGISSGSYYNSYSFNLFGGLSAGMDPAERPLLSAGGPDCRRRDVEQSAG